MSESLNQSPDVISAEQIEPIQEKLDPQAAEFYRQTVAATELGELPEGMKRDFNLPKAEQVGAARDEALARLDIDYALRQQEAKADVQGMRQRSQAKKAEDEAATRLEGNAAHKKAYEEALADQAAAIEAKKAALSGDKLEKHHKAQQIELEAKKLAKQIADEAVAERKDVIATNGGGKAGARRAQLQDKRAEEQAEKDAWKERMGVGGATKQTKQQAASTKSAFEDDATAHGMNYKEWLAAGGEQGAKQRENALSPVLASSERTDGHEAKRSFYAVSAEIDVPLKGEDAFINNPEKGIFAVFDGMGGHAAGDVASRIAKETFEQALADVNDITDPEIIRQQLVDGMDTVAANLTAHTASHPESHGMGTTAVVSKVVHSGDKAYLAWASVGDSRIYLQNGTEHGTEEPQQINVDEGVGNHLSNVLDAWYEEIDSRNSGVIELQHGSRIMLCSDGITGDWEDQLIDPQDMKRAFDMRNPQDAAEELLALSKKEDDKTLVLVDIYAEDSRAPEEDEGTPEPSGWSFFDHDDRDIWGFDDDDQDPGEGTIGLHLVSSSVLPKNTFASPDGDRMAVVTGDAFHAPAEVKLPAEIERQLWGARDAYIEAAAKSSRKQVGDYFNENTRIGRWLRKDLSGRRGQFLNAVEKFNYKTDKTSKEAYAQYLGAQVAAGKAAHELFADAGIAPDVQRALAALAASAESIQLESSFSDARQELSDSKQSKIANFWIKRTIDGGLKGNTAKALVVGVPSAIVGFGAAVASAPFWVPTAAAFGIASGVSRVVTRNEANVKLSKRADGTTETYGDRIATQENHKTNKSIDQGSTTDVLGVMDRFENRRTSDIGERRLRARNIRKIAATAMGVGNYFGNQIVDSPRVTKSAPDQNNSGRPSATTTSEAQSPTTGVPEATSAEPLPRSSIPNWSPEQWDNFDSMMQWRENMKAMNPNITDAELIEGWGKYLRGVSGSR